MLVLTFDLKKAKRRMTVLSLTLAVIVAFCGVASAVSRIYRRNEYEKEVSAEPFKKLIVIDAGHGGEDCGAIGVTGVLEKDLNLDVAFNVGRLLQDEGYLVVYTRSEDKMLYAPDEDVKGIRKISDLKNRCKIAESYPDAVFVSIHMNSFGDSRYSGLQVYYSENNEGSERLASSVQAKVCELVQKENKRNVKAGSGLYLLENISGEAILVECGFLTNEEECKKLSEKEYQNALSFAIVCGIIEYVENN